MDFKPNQMDPPAKSPPVTTENLGYDVFCNTPLSDIEAPLSPVLSNSKQSIKYIARRKSQIKLKNKFSQNATQSQQSQINLDPIISNQINLGSDITNKNDNTSLQSINFTNTDINIDFQSLNASNTSLTETSDIELKMRQIKDIQRSKKFLYTIPQNDNHKMTKNETNLTKSLNDFQFKMPVSPMSSSKTKAVKKRNDFSKPKLNLEICFETGAGKIIQLPERALQRTVKLFDDILDMPLDNFESDLNSPLKSTSTNLKTTENMYSRDLNLSEKICTTNNNYCENQNDLKTNETLDESINNRTNHPELSGQNCLKTSPIESIVKFTQISDTQMCFVAESTESILDCINTQWSPSPEDVLTVVTHKPDVVKSLNEDFDDFSTQDTDLYFGNITLCSDGTLTSRTIDMEPDFLGFEIDSNSKSLQTAALYKQIIGYLIEDVTKKVFYPLSFTCSDIEHSIEYRNKHFKYSLRPRKSNFTSTKKISKEIKKKPRENTNNKAMKRRKLSLEDNKQNILNSNKLDSNCNKPKCTNVENISNYSLKINDSNNQNNETCNTNPVNIGCKTVNIQEDNLHDNIRIEDTSIETSTDQSLPSTDQSLSSTDESTILTGPIFKNPCLGFSTASGFKIAITLDALKKTKHLFDDCDLNLYEDQSSNITTHTPESTIEAVTFSEISLSGDSNPERSLTIETSHEASRISENILKNSRSIFEDPSEPCTIEMQTPELRLGFSTASGKSVKISEESLYKARKIFDDCELPNEENELESADMSDPASQKLLNDLKEELSLNETLFQNLKEDFEEIFESAKESIQDIEVTEETLKQINNMFEECEDYNQPLNQQTLGFSSASGKKINISEEALKKTKNMFEGCDFDEENIDTKKIENLDTFATAPGKKLESFEELKKEKDWFEDYDTNKTAINVGFTTAAGKKVGISEDSLNKVKSLFDGCEVTEEELIKHGDTSKTIANFGFATASGKKVNISEDSLKKAKSIFDGCEVTEEDLSKHCDTTTNVGNIGFTTASGKKVNISEDALRKTKSLFEECEVTEDELTKYCDTSKNVPIIGFTTGSGKEVSISEDALKKSKSLFEDCEVTEEELSKSFDTPKKWPKIGFATASGKNVAISEDSLMKAKTLFLDCEVAEEVSKNYNTPKNEEKFGFATASGRKVDISEDSLAKVRDIFEDSELPSVEASYKFNTLKNVQIHFACGSGTRKVEQSFKRTRNVFEEPINSDARQLHKVQKRDDEHIPNSLPHKKPIPPFISPLLGTKSSPQIKDSTPILRNKSLKKRSLGVKSCKQLDIPEASIKRAKLVFDEADTPKKIYNLNNQTAIVTPVKAPQIKIIPQFNSAIKKSNQIQSSPKISSIKPTSEAVVKTTPIKQELLESDASYVFHEPTNCDLKELTMNFQKEYELLKLKMSVIEKRMETLKTQQEVIDKASPEHSRQRPGHLYLKKTQSKNRISLKKIVQERRPQQITHDTSLHMGVSPSILEINPENASKLHFLVPWGSNDHHTYPVILRTEDGAVIVPNPENQIGISELEIAFKTMPGVEPNLIPNGWVSNHYKWIVWKLACMERNYPDVFKDYLTIEHVVAQLKYRYDREIDKAERPALRKIFELDDIPMKRMVLCVSKIIKYPDRNLDLELTDGWYCVKTQIDSPLNSLVEKGIITVGMKLMIQGAELMNCEGCAPLEVPEHVRLRIHFNSTRRAAWHLKLGYQLFPGHLCISLRTVNNNGGPVGLTCAYISRVYPVSYMERIDDQTVWRNWKAEQNRSNEWESKQSQIMEQVQQLVQHELEEEWQVKKRGSRKAKGTVKDIQGVTCAKTLFEFMEASNDPDSIREILTSSQYEAVQNYQNQLAINRQSELSSRLQYKLINDNIKPRSVSSVLKLLLVDVNHVNHSRILNIWKPKDQHLHDLKEGSVVNIYNVTVRNNGALSSSPRSQFDLDLNYDTEKFESLGRTVLSISETKNPDIKPNFGEFDTVGLIVCIDIQPTSQSLWLVDEKFQFLVIKIRESPQTCCLYGSLSVGKVTAAINLVYRKPSNCGEALANHYTIFSTYPPSSCLQEYMTFFNESLPEDLESYIAECKDHLKLFALRKQCENRVFPCGAKSQEMRNELCGVKEGMTLSDEEMSLIDTQFM